MSFLRVRSHLPSLSRILSLRKAYPYHHYSQRTRFLCTSVPPPPSSNPSPSSSTPASSTKSNPPPNSSSDPNASTSTPSEDADLKLFYDAILSEVQHHGFTTAAIDSALSKLQWSPAARAMLPHGPADVVHELQRRCDVRLAELLSSATPVTEPDIDRASYAIRTRLEMLDQFHPHWASAMKLRAMPQHAARSVRSGLTLTDEIAHYAGYTAPDVSWYTDRFVIGVTYNATELFWMGDTSDGRVHTWSFLERRLRETEQLRLGASNAYSRVMNFSDATFGTLATLVKSARRSY